MWLLLFVVVCCLCLCLCCCLCLCLCCCYCCCILMSKMSHFSHGRKCSNEAPTGLLPVEDVFNVISECQMSKIRTGRSCGALTHGCTDAFLGAWRSRQHLHNLFVDSFHLNISQFFGNPQRRSFFVIPLVIHPTLEKDGIENFPCSLSLSLFFRFA